MKQILLLLLVFAYSCHCQSTSPAQEEAKSLGGAVKLYGSPPDQFLEGQVSEYIRRMFQDKNGHLWLGTNGDGVCRYDEKNRSLTYFTRLEGFSGNAVRGIITDDGGNLWFATDGGVCRYDAARASHLCLQNTCKHNLQSEKDITQHDAEVAKAFTRYTERDGLAGDNVWSILRDHNGVFWFGTDKGVSRYVEGLIFKDFPLPAADLSVLPDAYPAPRQVSSIVEDKAGNIWFGTNGNGVYRYDGSTLSNFSEKDGLCNNVVQCILEDSRGDFWFGSRFGGLTRCDAKSLMSGKPAFQNFSEKEGLCSNFVWTMLEDKNGNLWIATAGGGLCRYDAALRTQEKPGSPARVVFTGFSAQDGLKGKHVQSILEDKNGNLWFGLSGGLYRYNEKAASAGQPGFVNVKKSGPWEAM